jgi:hypothetical protein
MDDFIYGEPIAIPTSTTTTTAAGPGPGLPASR